MRTVVRSDMVCHLWAHKSQDRARNSKQSVFFEYDTIYSYGHHFPMARHVTNPKGEAAVLLNTATYSCTTSHHQSMTRFACRHIEPCFRVPEVNPLGHDRNLDDYDRRILEFAQQAKRARKYKDSHLYSMKETLKEARAYARFFDLKRSFKAPSDLDLKKIEEEAREAARRERQRLEAAAEKLRLHLAEAVMKWQAGEIVHLYGHPDTFLRVKDDRLQTSRGAEVPLAHGVRLLPLIRSGRGYQHNGHTEHVGHFRVDEIDTQGNIWVGCHFIKRDEVERVAAQLGL